MARGRPSRATIYQRLDDALNELNERFGGLPSPKESETVWSEKRHLEAHHSTALEGNTLALREVAQLLDRRRAVGAKPLKEYMEVEGYSDAARWVYGQALDPDDWSDGSLINLNEVRRIHHMAMLADWVAEVVELGATMASGTELDVPLPEVLAQLHHRFECIHPFIDGNGRVGRLALNLVLVRLGYPPVVIFKKQRDAYLSALQRSDEGDHGALGEIIARAMLDNLNRFVVPNVAGPARLVPLTALADDDFSVAALRQAAQRGRLDAVQSSDGIWRSSRNAVNEYAATKHTRRPKTE